MKNSNRIQNSKMAETKFNKGHNIFEKDVFRVMKSERIIEKNLIKKPSGQRSILDFNNSKYKTKSQLIMEQYENP
jgi:hypothetical protein